MAEEKVYDCIIIGAGPGGLQAAIYLGRYNMNVLLIDRGGGRTHHARQIENFLSHKVISGREILERGLEQARSFSVRIEKARVDRVVKSAYFEINTAESVFLSRFLIVSSGVSDNLPPIENLHKFLGTGYFTCVDCDGYKTMGRKLVVLGNSIHTVRLAFALKEMYTSEITLMLYFYEPPDDFKELLAEEGIPLIKGRPTRFIGDEILEALELEDGRLFECEAVMGDFGYKLNDAFLSELPLKRDGKGFKYVTNHHFESSLDGLYIIGPLNTGTDQVVVAAGEGAVAAIEIKKRILQI